MPTVLLLNEVTDYGSTQVARLESGEIVVGREPAHGVALNSPAISREHGVFAKIGMHWFYRDLGSTNGSWINSEKVEDPDWFLVRSGDYVQLADLALQLAIDETASSMGSASRAQSLIIFSGGQLVDEYPVPQYGRALVIGGSAGDLEMRGDIAEEPSLVIERRGDRVCAFQVARQSTATINGSLLEETIEVNDRDRLAVGEYQIIVNLPRRLAGLTPEEGVAGVKGWGEDRSGPDLVAAGPPGQEVAGDTFAHSHRSAIPFGRPIDEAEADQTITIDPDTMGTIVGMDMHPSMRSSLDDTTGAYSFRSVEDKVILVIGLVLMMLLVFLVVWWVFAS